MIELNLPKWKDLLQNNINEKGNKQSDYIDIIYLCEDYSNEARNIISQVSEHLGFIDQIKIQYMNLYRLRFGEMPPPKASKALEVKPIEPINDKDIQENIAKASIQEIILDTPEKRKNAVIEVSLAISQPSLKITAQAIQDEMKHRNYKIVADKPNSVISTIMGNFTDEFERVPNEKGTFKRLVKPLIQSEPANVDLPMEIK